MTTGKAFKATVKQLQWEQSAGKTYVAYPGLGFYTYGPRHSFAHNEVLPSLTFAHDDNDKPSVLASDRDLTFESARGMAQADFEKTVLGCLVLGDE